MILSQIPALNASDLGSWIIGMVGVLVIVDIGLRIVDRFRRRPPFEVEFASKAELKEIRTGIESRVGGIEASMHSGVTRAEFMNFQGAVAAQIGQLSGQLSGTVEKLREAIEELRADVQVKHERSASDIYEKVNHVTERVAALEAINRG